jgi:hypothetical protein
MADGTVTAPNPVCGAPGSTRWPVAALGLLALGWAAYLVADAYTRRLAEQWGPAPDVVDVLIRAPHVARRALPCHLVAVLLDAAAGLVLLARSRWGWPLAVKVVTGVLLVPSAGLHGLVFLACGLWAAPRIW